jgi:hypothetical protein
MLGEGHVDGMVQGRIVSGAKRGARGQVRGQMKDEVHVPDGAPHGGHVDGVTVTELYARRSQMLHVAVVAHKGAHAQARLQQYVDQVPSQHAAGAGDQGTRRHGLAP